MSKFNKKLFMLSTILVIFLSLLHVNVYANYNNDDLMKQYEILQDYLKFTNATRKYDGDNGILFIGYGENKKIGIGIADINDEELINNILSIEGIDSDLVEFAEFRIAWDSFATELPDNETIMPFTTSLQMGQIIDIGGYLLTLGPPTNSSGTHFYIANHGAIRNGQIARLGWSNTTIGLVDQVRFARNVDVSRVNLSNYGYKAVPAVNITNFRGTTPATGTSVRAFTGFSCTVTGNILYSSASVPGPAGQITDMIIVGMTTQEGDSGSGLVHGSSAIGVLSFGAYYDGIPVTVFSKITNI